MAVYLAYLPELGKFGVNYTVRSPIPKHIRGSVDRTPSFNLRQAGGRIRWKDHAMDKGYGSSPEDFVIVMEGLRNGIPSSLPEDEKNNLAFMAARHFINNTILKGGEVSTEVPERIPKMEVIIPELEYSDDYTEAELKYMDRYWITPDILKFNWVYGLRKADFGHFSFGSTENDPAFLIVFSWKDGEPFDYKIYRPFQNKVKFKFKMVKQSAKPLLEGLPQLIEQYRKYGKMSKIYGVSSTKDRMVMNVSGMFAIAATGENHKEGWAAYLPMIFKMCDEFVWLNDTDGPGISSCFALSDQFGGLHPHKDETHMRGMYGYKMHPISGEKVLIKDQSDFVDKQALRADKPGKIGNTPDDLRGLIQGLTLYRKKVNL